ncbi:PEP-CTERM sorting domain-containing protein [Roseomonas sp. CAU 1739]|uniref:PEP-CTERM sorting domain-containing protein n=1 Tax=Roseomonas sp. CAU 1739 TaxID=3140364 RepID=UPI00325AA466
MDTITITGLTSGSVSGFLSAHVEGSIDRNGLPSDYPDAASATFQISARDPSHVIYNVLNFIDICPVGASCVDSEYTKFFIGNGSWSETVLVPFTVTAENPSFVLDASLSVFTQLGGAANFGNTATLGMNLPDGYSFTSESGYFLTRTDPPTTVPEPASLSLFGVCLVGFAMIGKRRRRHSA